MSIDVGVAADHSPPTNVVPLLSKREIEVLLAWFAADSKASAAAALFISVGTINTHISRVRLKYACASRPASTKTALFARAVQDRITTIDDW